MPHMICGSGHPAWSALLTFLQRAALAQQNGQAEARAIWLDAAALLQAVDDDRAHHGQPSGATPP
jgi:hypothetical protein